jgi:hypothetical protein
LVLIFLEAAVFALGPLFTLSELREGDRHPKVNTPMGRDWRILMISHHSNGLQLGLSSVLTPDEAFDFNRTRSNVVS